MKISDAVFLVTYLSPGPGMLLPISRQSEIMHRGVGKLDIKAAVREVGHSIGDFRRCGGVE